MKETRVHWHRHKDTSYVKWLPTLASNQKMVKRKCVVACVFWTAILSDVILKMVCYGVPKGNTFLASQRAEKKNEKAERKNGGKIMSNNNNMYVEVCTRSSLNGWWYIWWYGAGAGHIYSRVSKSHKIYIQTLIMLHNLCAFWCVCARSHTNPEECHCRRLYPSQSVIVVISWHSIYVRCTYALWRYVYFSSRRK